MGNPASVAVLLRPLCIFLAIRQPYMLKKPPHKPIGETEHRSGWPYVMQNLAGLWSDDGILFDDFVERTFLYTELWHNNHVYTSPWVGIAHHAQDIPTWYLHNLQPWTMIESYRWRESFKHLRLLITLAPNLAQWYKLQYPDLPVAVIKHPTGRPNIMWTPERFANNPHKQLLQVGWFCRNTVGIYQVPTPNDWWLRKSYLRQAVQWAGMTARLCHQYYRDTPFELADVIVLPAQSAVAYDQLLASNVVFMEVISAVANNTVIECIARNTPIVLNRHPGPMYYLGADYPLFYDDISQIPQLVTAHNVQLAYEYLRKMDKIWICGSSFAESVVAACQQVIPECRNFQLPDYRQTVCTE